MAINKVEYGGNTLIDLTSDTVTAGDIKSGVKAHDKTGTVITGTFASETKTATPKTSDQTISPTSGKYLSNVTVKGVSVPSAGNILSGSSVTSNGTTLVSGTMPNNPVYSSYISQGGKSSSVSNAAWFNFPYGYHPPESGTTQACIYAKDTVIGSAVQSEVLKDKTFTSSAGVKLSGTMTNNGAVAPSGLNCGGSYTIPAGYHNGSGKVTANSLASQTGVDSGKTAIIAGAVMSGYQGWVNGTKITGAYNPPTPTPIHDPLQIEINDLSWISYTDSIGAWKTVSAGISETEANKIIPENIKNGVTLFGVDGTYTGEDTRPELETIWINPSPTKNFAAQTVAMDLSKYAGIVVYSKTSINTSGDGLGQFCTVTESNSVTLHCAWATSYTRAATISTTGITFKDGKNNAVSPPSTANASCIPTKVVGIVATPRNIEYKYHEAFLTTSSKMTIDCGFRPTRIMINIGVLDTGISDSNYKANIVIDANGYWTDVHTNASGGSGYSSHVAMGSTAMGCTWNITNTGFEITCTNSNYTARKWCFTIVGE